MPDMEVAVQPEPQEAAEAEAAAAEAVAEAAEAEAAAAEAVAEAAEAEEPQEEAEHEPEAQTGGAMLGAPGPQVMSEPEARLRQRELSDILAGLRKYYAYVFLYATELGGMRDALSESPTKGRTALTPYARFVLFALAARGGFAPPSNPAGTVQLTPPSKSTPPVLAALLHDMWLLGGKSHPLTATAEMWVDGVEQLRYRQRVQLLNQLIDNGLPRNVHDAMTHLKHLWGDVDTAIHARFKDLVSEEAEKGIHQRCEYVMGLILSAHSLYHNACTRKLASVPDLAGLNGTFPSSKDLSEMVYSTFISDGMTFFEVLKGEPLQPVPAPKKSRFSFSSK